MIKRIFEYKKALRDCVLALDNGNTKRFQPWWIWTMVWFSISILFGISIAKLVTAGHPWVASLLFFTVIATIIFHQWERSAEHNGFMVILKYLTEEAVGNYIATQNHKEMYEDMRTKYYNLCFKRKKKVFEIEKTT